MSRIKDEDLLWYVGTRRDSGAHFVVNEYYMEKYENEFDRIREYDTAEEAVKAMEAREQADRDAKGSKHSRENIKVSKIRGTIRKGNDVDESALREELRKEILAELEGAKATPAKRTTTAKK